MENKEGSNVNIDQQNRMLGTVTSFLASMGFMDTVALVLFLFGLCYYLFQTIRSRSPPEVQYKKLTIAAPITRSESYDSSFISKMKKGGKNVVVFYGSQTGTAEEFASRLVKDSKRYRMNGMSADPEECEMEELPNLNTIENSLAIFCMATYGEGEPTDNSVEFIDLLKSGDLELDGLNYAVFGLGNKTYEHYNSIGELVDERLAKLGGNRIHPLGLGDDDSNIEEDFVTWCENFWPAVCEKFGILSTGDDISLRQYTLKLADDIPAEKVFLGEPARLGSFRNQRMPFDMKNPYLATLAIKRELHKSGDRSCMHIEFDLGNSKIRYEAGDHLAIYPANETTQVISLGQRLGYEGDGLDQIFYLENTDPEANKRFPFPCPCSFRTALTYYVDINSPPRTHVLKEMKEFATEEKDKVFLNNLTASTPEAKQLYNSWIMQPRRNILAVLEDLPSLMPPIDLILELLPKLQARYYSISSSPKVHPKSVHITAVLVEYMTITGRKMHGVTTQYLANIEPGSSMKVPIYVRKSSFKLPFRTVTPICLIGPGTGFAPLRGFIQERNFHREQGKPIGSTILFFGCRKKAEDFLYEDEIEEYLNSGTLTSLHVAYSRDQAEKVYVQHMMRENKDELWQIIDGTGHIYVCGDAKSMAPDVLKTLQDIIAEKKQVNAQEASDILKRMHTKGRYNVDVWS